MKSLLYASACFEQYVLIIRMSKLYYTASGIITPVGGRPVRRLREDSTAKYKKKTADNVYVIIPMVLWEDFRLSIRRLNFAVVT